MLILLYFMIFIFLSQNLFCSNVVRQFRKLPDNADFKLNDSVTLCCEIQEVRNSLVVMFRKDKAMYSESCRIFNNIKYEMTCNNFTKDDRPVSEYRFKIKHLEWADRGKWECMYAQNKRFITIEIIVPAKFENLKIDPMKPPEVELKNIGPAYPTIELNPSSMLKGRGSRTNPYNLRDGTALKITCFSSCSYPNTTHLWSFANVSHGPYDIKAQNTKLRDICSSPNSEGMFSTQSDTIINCTTLKMVGANEVVCKADSDKTSVYVLCQGGEKPWELTTGEIIGLATSVGIIILLIFLLCLMVKRSKSVYLAPTDVKANTYSSGVKV